MAFLLLASRRGGLPPTAWTEAYWRAWQDRWWEMVLVPPVVGALLLGGLAWMAVRWAGRRGDAAQARMMLIALSIFTALSVSATLPALNGAAWLSPVVGLNDLIRGTRPVYTTVLIGFAAGLCVAARRRGGPVTAAAGRAAGFLMIPCLAGWAMTLGTLVLWRVTTPERPDWVSYSIGWAMASAWLAWFFGRPVRPIVRPGPGSGWMLRGLALFSGFLGAAWGGWLLIEVARVGPGGRVVTSPAFWLMMLRSGVWLGAAWMMWRCAVRPKAMPAQK